jgi:hypothetical protein
MNGWEVSLGHAVRRWMYYVESFTSLLDAVGYTQMVMCDAGESKLAEFAELDRRIGKELQSFYVEAARGTSQVAQTRT